MQFTGRVPESRADRGFDAEAKFKPKVHYMVEVVSKLKGRGLSSERIIRTLMQQRL